MRTKDNKRSADKGEKDNLSTTPSIVDDDDKSVKSLGMLADVADEASRKATDKNELLRDSSVETTVIQNNSKSGNAKGGGDEKDEESSPTHNNYSNPANNNRSILKHTHDASFSESNPPPPTRIALKRQRSAPNTNRSESQQQRPPAMVSRNRSTGSRLSFSDKVQICSSDASSSQQQQQGNSNNNNLNKPATLHNRQHSMESLKLPSFIRTCDRQFSLESIMSFRSQESNFNYSGSASGKLTPVMENRRSDTPTSVDTPNTAKMEQFYQECMGNNNSSNSNNAADNSEELNDKNDKNGGQSFRPPLKKQKVSADEEKGSSSSSKTTTTTATTKDSTPSSGAPTDAKVKPPPLQGQGLRGWLSGSGSSSQSNHSNGTHSGGSIPFPAGSSSNGFPPSFSSYSTNQGGPSGPYPPTVGGGYPSKPPFVGYNTSTSSAHPHHQQHHHGGVVRSVTTDQTPASPAQRRPSPPQNSSALKFGHPRPEVVEGQQIYSRHTLLLWGAHKSDISPINGNIQEGCDSILIHPSSSSSSGSSKQQQPNTLQSKDDIRFTQMKCTLRNGGAALFALYQQQQKQHAHPIRVFTQSQGAGGIIGYRYDGLYSITGILDDATGKLKSDPTHCSSERICVLFERNPSTSNNCAYPNRLSLEELWAIVDPNPQQQETAPTSSPSPPANYHPSSNVGTAKTSQYPAKPPRMTTPSISQQAPYGGGPHHHYPHYPHQPSPTSPQQRPQYNYSYNGGNPQSHPNKGNLRRQASAEVSMIHIQYFDEPHQHHRPVPPPQAYY